jgi:hypothetical protein
VETEKIVMRALSGENSRPYSSMGLTLRQEDRRWRDKAVRLLFHVFFVFLCFFFSTDFSSNKIRHCLTRDGSVFPMRMTSSRAAQTRFIVAKMFAEPLCDVFRIFVHKSMNPGTVLENKTQHQNQISEKTYHRARHRLALLGMLPLNMFGQSHTWPIPFDRHKAMQ